MIKLPYLLESLRQRVGNADEPMHRDACFAKSIRLGLKVCLGKVLLLVVSNADTLIVLEVLQKLLPRAALMVVSDLHEQAHSSAFFNSSHPTGVLQPPDPVYCQILLINIVSEHQLPGFEIAGGGQLWGFSLLMTGHTKRR